MIAGLTLSHAGVSLQTATGKPGSTVMQNAPSTESIAHIVGQHAPLSGLTPIVTPMTVVSQGNQVTAHILAPSSLAGKMITTPILKTVGQMPLMNAQYLNTTTLVKPVVVVSSPSTSTPPAATTASSSTQPSSTSHSTVWQNQGKIKLIWSRWNIKTWFATVFCNFFMFWSNRQKSTFSVFFVNSATRLDTIVLTDQQSGITIGRIAKRILCERIFVHRAIFNIGDVLHF